MGKVFILCGKIASGKTTYASKLKSERKAVILSHDDLMLTLFDNCLGDKHDDMINRFSKYFYKLAEDLVAIDVDVILDFGYWSKAERVHGREYFNSRGIPVEIHYITIPEEQRLRQLLERNEKLKDATSRVFIIGDKLRERLDSKFEEPEKDEVDVILNGIF